MKLARPFTSTASPTSPVEVFFTTIRNACVALNAMLACEVESNALPAAVAATAVAATAVAPAAAPLDGKGAAARTANTRQQTSGGTRGNLVVRTRQKLPCSVAADKTRPSTGPECICGDVESFQCHTKRSRDLASDVPLQRKTYLNRTYVVQNARRKFPRHSVINKFRTAEKRRTCPVVASSLSPPHQ